MTSGTVTVLHLAGAPYRGTVCHTHCDRNKVSIIPGNDIRDSDSVLHSAGAPYRGTVGHTHSVRSGTTLTSSDLLYQAMTAGQRLCAAFGRRTL